MARYLVEMQHAKEQCQNTMDYVADKGPELLEKVWWSCPSGEHNAWVFVAANDTNQAIDLVVPKEIKDSAKAHEISQLNQDAIREMHKAA